MTAYTSFLFTQCNLLKCMRNWILLICLQQFPISINVLAYALERYPITVVIRKSTSRSDQHSTVNEPYNQTPSRRYWSLVIPCQLLCNLLFAGLRFNGSDSLTMSRKMGIVDSMEAYPANHKIQTKSSVSSTSFTRFT